LRSRASYSWPRNRAVQGPILIHSNFNLINELLSLFGGKPVMAHMVQSGQLTLEDVKEAEQELRRLAKRERKAK
jgi:hypothetical protein